jgi:NAD(P)-dependent dehydrogenase (short-subunit alcohol dehydrogenase family)
MNPVYDFTGQVARITGASSGIGLAAAAMMMSRANGRAVRRAAAQQGARLCGNPRTKQAGQQLRGADPLGRGSLSVAPLSGAPSGVRCVVL